MRNSLANLRRFAAPPARLRYCLRYLLAGASPAGLWAFAPGCRVPFDAPRLEPFFVARQNKWNFASSLPLVDAGRDRIVGCFARRLCTARHRVADASS